MFDHQKHLELLSQEENYLRTRMERAGASNVQKEQVVEQLKNWVCMLIEPIACN